MKIAALQAHNLSHCDALWVCTWLFSIHTVEYRFKVLIMAYSARPLQLILTKGPGSPSWLQANWGPPLLCRWVHHRPTWHNSVSFQSILLPVKCMDIVIIQLFCWIHVTFTAIFECNYLQKCFYLDKAGQPKSSVKISLFICTQERRVANKSKM